MSADEAIFADEGGKTPQNPNDYVRAYLCSRSGIFRELAKVQDEGWKMTSGDEHFKKQRETADNPDAKVSLSFFKLMRRIGNEMQDTTGVMSLPDPGQILDLCMAPGGYSASVLKFNRRASISGATLPEKLGGHKLIFLDEFGGARAQVWEGDLTSLIGDMGMNTGDISEEHPNFGKFQKEEVWGGERFDLVFCDGQVLRNHSRSMAEERQRCEARRLTCSQLLIALRHIKVGGSMVMLLHRLDRWDTVLTLRALDRFADIAVFKPLTSHRVRSSFYLVAKKIQPDHPAALEAIQNWTEAWKDATFRALEGEGRDDAFSQDQNESMVLGERVKQVMNEFGDKLISLGEPAWKIQEEAIKNSPWFKNK